MEPKLFLFSHRSRFYGLISILVSLACAWLYFRGGKADLFNIRIFAMVSAYMETRYFVWAQTNILDELSTVLLIAGITIISFSKEMNESELLNLFRIKALYNSLFITLLLWICCIFLIYGLAIFTVSSGVMILYLIIYNILFRYYRYNHSHSSF